MADTTAARLDWRNRPLSETEAYELGDLALKHSPNRLTGVREAALFALLASGLSPEHLACLPRNHDISGLPQRSRERVEAWRKQLPSDWHYMFTTTTNRGKIKGGIFTETAIRDKVSSWRNPNRRPHVKRGATTTRAAAPRAETATGEDGLCACRGQVSGFCNGREDGDGRLVNCRWDTWNRSTRRRAALQANTHARAKWNRENARRLKKMALPRRHRAVQRAIAQINIEYPTE